MRTPEEIGVSLTLIVAAMNDISIEEIDAMLGNISRDSALGPMLDPTKWAREGLFEAAHKTQKVLGSIRQFKIDVSGMGNFKVVDNAKD